jgi:LCP family protein required for cell wall assembly
MIEEELRDTFARHETQAPALDPLRRAIDALAARRRRRRAVTRAGAVAVVAALTVAVPVQVWRDRAADALGPVVGSAAPAAAPQGTLNLLLLGVDHTIPDARTRTMMLIHLPADGRRAYLISIEPDVVADIPGHGSHKINASYYLGGAEGARGAVEKLTGIRADAIAVVRFTALRSVVDAIGGVPVCLPEQVRSHHTPTVYPPGCAEYGGRQVEDLVRQHASSSMWMFDRDRIGQQVVKGLARKAAALDLLRDADKVRRLAGTPGITIDTGDLTLLGLVRRLDAIAPGDITGLSQPAYKPGRPATVGLDPDAPQLFTAVREGTVEVFVARHPDWVLQE